MTAETKRVTAPVGHVDVRSFGAKGDGVANDQPAIQAAIDTGRDIFFPLGHTFLLGRGLTVSTPNQSLVGGGESTLRHGKDEPAVTVSAEPVSIEGLAFDDDERE